MTNEPIKSFQIHLHFHVKPISVNFHKATPCSHPHGSNSVVVFLYQEKSDNEDLEIEIATRSDEDMCV